MFEKKTQTESRASLQKREKGKATTIGKRGASQKEEGIVERFTRGLELLSVYNSKLLVCTDDTAIYRVCVAYANSDSRRNKTYGSPLGCLSLNSSTAVVVQHRRNVLYSNAMLLLCSCRIRTHTTAVYSDYRVRLVLYSDTKNMPPAFASGTTRTAVLKL